MINTNTIKQQRLLHSQEVQGGGVYLQNGKYVGMIVRGAGEGFNLMVPLVRRMKAWAKKNDIMWAIDPKGRYA